MHFDVTPPLYTVPSSRTYPRIPRYAVRQDRLGAGRALCIKRNGAAIARGPLSQALRHLCVSFHVAALWLSAPSNGLKGPLLSSVLGGVGSCPMQRRAQPLRPSVYYSSAPRKARAHIGRS